MTIDPVHSVTEKHLQKSRGGNQAPRREVRNLSRWPGVACAALCLIGLVLRCTIRDAWTPLAMVYYALPLPVLAGFACAAGLLLRRLSGRVACGFAILGATLALAAFGSGYRARSGVRPPDALDAVFWNTARGARGWDEVAEEVRRFDAPIVGLVEAGPDTDEMREFWKHRFADREVAVLGNGMVLIVRGQILTRTTGALGTHSDFAVVDVRVANRKLTVVLVDIVSTPWKPRGKSLETLAALLESLGDRPVIVMGDFNTPPESVHFSRIRRGFRPAFDSAGDGYAATWPVPFPVLALDQIWLNERVSVHACRHLWSTRSDHRPVRATISLHPTPPGS